MSASLNHRQQQTLIEAVLKSINQYNNPPDASYEEIFLHEIIAYNLQDWTRDFDTRPTVIDWEQLRKSRNDNPHGII